MRSRGKIAGSIASIALTAVLVSSFLAIGAIAGRVVPENPISDPPAALASPTMIVAPNGNEGQSDQGQDQTSSDQSDSQQEEQQNAQESDEQTVLGSSDTTGGAQYAGGGAGVAGGGAGSSGKPTADGNTPGIATNLSEFGIVDQDTRAPSSLSFTLDGRSGFDRDSSAVWFYAKPNDYAKGYSVEVQYSNEGTTDAKVELIGDNALYSTPIVMTDGSVTTVTLTLLDAGGNVSMTVDYYINYVGRQGPDVEVNLEDGQTVETENFTLAVSAHDHYDGSEIYPDHLQVYLDGSQVTDHTASDPYEYTLYLGNATADQTAHTVTVVATDYSSEKASTTVTRQLIYIHHAMGEKIGTVSVYLDMTTVGLGVQGPISVDIHEGYPFPYDLAKGMETQGYSFESDSNPSLDDPEDSGWSNYYLSRISRGGLCAGASVPDMLWNKVNDDKITITGSSSSDSLGEFDYTAESGWLYEAGGGWWPSTNLSGYIPSDGDSITLVFEIGGGKDVGHASSGNGALPSYCGTWIGGSETISHDLSVYVVTKEATCTEEGQARWECSVEHDYDASNGTDTVDFYGAFGDTEGGSPNRAYITLPMAEHTWVLTRTDEPTATEPGMNYYTCSVCGQTKTEEIPATGQTGGGTGGGTGTQTGGGTDGSSTGTGGEG